MYKVFSGKDTFHSEITEEDYCCEECRKTAEQTYKKENWHYSDYDEEYYEHAGDITVYRVWNNILCEYEEKTYRLSPGINSWREESFMNWTVYSMT